MFGSEDFGYRSRQCQQQDVVDDGDADDSQKDVNRQRREVDELIDRVGAGELGGPADFAQGGGPDVDALDGALDEAPDVLRTVLNA